jgi:signal transduction histidine kinase/ActR/RegA family two-component response regulator
LHAPSGGPDSGFGSARAVIWSFLTLRLRRQFNADVARFSRDADAANQVAAGYMCLASAIGFVFSFIATTTLNPAHIEAHIFAVLNVIGGIYGFLQIRHRGDPRKVMEWLLVLFLLTTAVVSYRQSGAVAPIMASLPSLAGIAALFLKGTMRIALFLGALVVVGFGLLVAAGLIGEPSPYTPQARAIMTFVSMTFAALGLGGIAWVANLSRDYAVEQLRAANEEIVEASSRSRVALEAAKVGLWDVPDMERRKFHVSESFQTITGYTAEEFNLLFGRVEEFIHADDVVQLREAFAVGRQRMSRLRVDFRLKTKDRGYRWFSARARYSKNPDGSIRISGSLQDINFLKAAEAALRAGRDQAREANRAKSDFIAVMSHEVRTPLNAILGSVEVLKRVANDEETSELVGLIDDAGRGLLTIVNDLLDVSKIEAGKLEISPSPTDVCALLTRTMEFWRAQATDRGLTLQVDCGGAETGALMIDAGRVRQIIGNLLSNAIKFTDRGGVSASVSTHETRDGRVEVLISVIDTGPGVPDAIAETIFAPFEQASTNADRGGTGLGLFISRRLARLMGGDLTLEPARRDGAHFRLSLVADRRIQADQSPDIINEDPVWSGKRVLVVDDNENNRRIAELLLGKFGIDVTHCASGAEALDICGIETFDVILMDIVMPDMDGLETLKRIKADSGCPNQATPAIALTAKLSPDDIAAYATAGFDGVAGKPINIRELAQAIAPFMVERAASANDG